MNPVRVLSGFTSISAADGAYRVPIEELVQRSGVRVAWVGDQIDGTGRAHEGHVGWHLSQVRSHIEAWLDAAHAKCVIFECGTNDAPGDDAPAMLAIAGAILDVIVSRRLFVLVASIPPLVGHQATVDAFNSGLAQKVASMRARGARAWWCDAALTAPELRDGVHPNARGYQLMGAALAPALVAEVHRAGRSLAWVVGSLVFGVAAALMDAMYRGAR